MKFVSRAGNLSLSIYYSSLLNERGSTSSRKRSWSPPVTTFARRFCRLDNSSEGPISIMEKSMFGETLRTPRKTTRFRHGIVLYCVHFSQIYRVSDFFPLLCAQSRRRATINTIRSSREHFSLPAIISAVLRDCQSLLRSTAAKSRLSYRRAREWFPHRTMLSLTFIRVSRHSFIYGDLSLKIYGPGFSSRPIDFVRITLKNFQQLSRSRDEKRKVRRRRIRVPSPRGVKEFFFINARTSPLQGLLHGGNRVYIYISTSLRIKISWRPRTDVGIRIIRGHEL